MKKFTRIAAFLLVALMMVSVAAIAAALNVIMGEGKFVVKHIKRINNAPAWNRAGREEQVYSRF